MESSDEPIVDSFAIGPSTFLGRALALRVLLCNITKHKLWLSLAVVLHYARRGKRFTSFLGWKLQSWLNPRNPSVMLAAMVGAALLLRRARTVKLKAEMAYRRNFWKNMMKTVHTYEEWTHAASMLEKDSKRRKDSDLYDEDLVTGKLAELRTRRMEGGVEDILFCLRADLVRNLGNMCNPELHKGRLQMPKLIQEYIKEVRYHLYAVCNTNSEEFSLEEKIAFVYETRHAFGRTALLLSGGAALGAFHLGVVRTLIEHRLLPRVIAGASVGSIICSIAATRTWPELQSFFEDPNPPIHFFDSMGSIFATAHRLLTRGAVQEIGHLQRKMRQLIGDLTFQEAFELSGRVLGISVCSPRRHDPPRCLNYLTSPHVVIWSAVTASCAFPGLFEAQELMAKDRQGQLVPYDYLTHLGADEPCVRKRIWRDGSLESDLPMMHLKELFNVNHFIVSQANPHIAPLLRLKELVRTYGGDFAAKLAHLVEMEVKHRCKQALELGFPLGGIAKLFAQDWEGDVTIVMPATLAQFAKLIQNPTHVELRKAVMQGRRCTWEKLSAIQANCGIELMLDECVIELNRQLKAWRDTGRSLTQSTGGWFGAGVAKRIPSWICLPRENSSSSLDDDAIEVALPTGGPWGGPSVRKLRPRRSSDDASDTEAGGESTDQSWTKAGGPLMKSPSADKLVVMLEFHNESTVDGRQHDQACLQTEGNLAKLVRTKSLDRHHDKKVDKTWDHIYSIINTYGDGNVIGQQDQNSSRPFLFSGRAKSANDIFGTYSANLLSQRDLLHSSSLLNTSMGRKLVAYESFESRWQYQQPHLPCWRIDLGCEKSDLRDDTVILDGNRTQTKNGHAEIVNTDVMICLDEIATRAAVKPSVQNKDL